MKLIVILILLFNNNAYNNPFFLQFTAKEQLESALEELEALKRMILVSAINKENSLVVTTFDEDAALML